MRILGRPASSAILLSILSAALSGSAPGQRAKEQPAPDRDGRPRYIPQREYVVTGSISRLVFVPAVCEELKISPELRGKIMEARDRAVSFYEMQQINQALRNATQHYQEAWRFGKPDPARLGAAQQELTRARAAKSRAIDRQDGAVRAMLTPAQATRLHQILLRQEGSRALARDEVADELRLSEEQTIRVRQILAERDRMIQDWTDRLHNDPSAQTRAAEVDRVVRKAREQRPLDEEDRRVLTEFQKRGRIMEEGYDTFEQEIDVRLEGVLTAEQRARFSHMRGPDFDLRRLTRGAHPQAEPSPSSHAGSKAQEAKTAAPTSSRPPSASRP